MSTERLSAGVVRGGLIILAALILVMIFMMPMMGMMGMWWSGGMAGGFFSIWRIGMMLVWFVVFVGIGYLVYRGLVGGVGASTTADPALEELRLAYARGDLSAEEFEERRDRLNRKGE